MAADHPCKLDRWKSLALNASLMLEPTPKPCKGGQTIAPGKDASIQAPFFKRPPPGVKIHPPLPFRPCGSDQPQSCVPARLKKHFRPRMFAPDLRFLLPDLHRALSTAIALRAKAVDEGGSAFAHALGLPLAGGHCDLAPNEFESDHRSGPPHLRSGQLTVCTAYIDGNTTFLIPYHCRARSTWTQTSALKV